jgi:hypothetical protein
MTTTNKHAGPISAGFRGSAFKRAPIDDAERKAIIAAIQSGVPMYQIGREHNRGESQVREIARRAGLIKPPSPKAQRAETREICVSLPPNVASLLGKAAARRQLTPSSLAAQILVGVITRGVVDKPCDIVTALAKCAEDEQKKRETAEAAEMLRV